MFDKLHAKLTGQKLHDFDLDHPYHAMVYGHEINIYVCKKCGKQSGLDLWQMEDLPWSMKIGCR